MARPTAYDADILEWSEQQASALRDLARSRRNLPNGLDWEHVAEEIEDVGRSELVAVRSLVRQILIHVIKGVSAPGSEALLHWRKEVVGFHNDLLDRLTPAMVARIDLPVLWTRAGKEAEAALAIYGQCIAPALPADCPLTIEDIIAPDFDFLSVVDGWPVEHG